MYAYLELGRVHLCTDLKDAPKLSLKICLNDTLQPIIPQPAPDEHLEIDFQTATLIAVKNPVPPLSPKELTEQTTMLNAQVRAQTESATFLEDCIAEMALQVYK